MIISLSKNLLSLGNVIDMMVLTVANSPRGYHGGSNHCHSLCSRWMRTNDHGTVQLFGKDGTVYHSAITVDGKLVCDSLRGSFDAQGMYTFVQHDIVTAYDKIYDIGVSVIKKRAKEVVV